MTVVKIRHLLTSRPATKHVPAVQAVRMHDLRHTFATHQLSAVVQFMRVSKWLGYAGGGSHQAAEAVGAREPVASDRAFRRRV